MAVQPSNAKGKGHLAESKANRKQIALARRGKAARQTKSKAMMRDHKTGRKGTRNLNWWMSAGK